MANTDLHVVPMNEVQVKDNEEYYFVRLISTWYSQPWEASIGGGGGDAEPYATEGQAYPLGTGSK